MDYKNVAVAAPQKKGFFGRRTPTLAQDLSALAQLPRPGEQATIKGDCKSFDTKAAQKACGGGELTRLKPDGSIDYNGIRFEGEFSLKALNALIASSSPGTLDLTGIRFDPKERLTMADLESVDNKCRDYNVAGNPTGANVSRANLKRCELYNSMLKGGDLSGANLKGAHLETDLSGANLYKAKLNINPRSRVTLDCNALSSFLTGITMRTERNLLEFRFEFDSTVPVNKDELKKMIALAKEKNVHILLDGINLTGLDLTQVQIDPDHTSVRSLDTLEALPDRVTLESDRPMIRFDPPERLDRGGVANLRRICNSKGIIATVPRSKLPQEVPSTYNASVPPPPPYSA